MFVSTDKRLVVSDMNILPQDSFNFRINDKWKLS
jgi:hypothetical protein